MKPSPSNSKASTLTRRRFASLMAGTGLALPSLAMADAASKPDTGAGCSDLTSIEDYAEAWMRILYRNRPFPTYRDRSKLDQLEDCCESIAASLPRGPGGYETKIEEATGDAYERTYNLLIWPRAYPADTRTCYTVCAHLDTVEYSNSYEVVPGANDNASGAAAVVALAHAFAPYLNRLKFRLNFVLLGLEEYGMIGSAFHADKLRKEMKTRGTRHRVINLDTISGKKSNPDEPDFYMEYRGDLDPDFARGLGLACRPLSIVDINLHRAWVTNRLNDKPLRENELNSDHVSFMTRGIPAVGITQCNSYYGIMHEPTDKEDKCDLRRGYSAVQWIARYLEHEVLA